MYYCLKGLHERARSARAAVAATDAAEAALIKEKDVVVNAKSILASKVAPYVLIIHTGTNNPALDKIEKWEDGRMSFILNPQTTQASPLFHVKELFSANRESHIRVSKYLPDFVGIPEQLKISVESNKLEIIKEALYIREITILYKHKFYRFPVNDYLFPHNPLLMDPQDVYDGCPPYVISKCGKGTFLANETDPAVLAARMKELELRRKHLDWAPNNGPHVIPGCTKQVNYDKLPRFLKFKNARQKAFQLNLRRGHNMMKRTVIENKISVIFGKDTPEHFKSFKEFETLFVELAEDHGYDLGMVDDVLSVIKYWKTDEEFTRQELAGINPARIIKITTLPDTWDNMLDMPEHVMGEGVSLQAELEAGRMYMIDTNMLEVVGDGGILMPILTGFSLPMIVSLGDCLYYHDRVADTLRPVAIRLEYKNGGEAPTFWFPPKPSDSEISPEYLSWLQAKLYFRSSNMQIHAILTHFVRAHAVVEVFAIAMYRCLPKQHPLHKLLQPHLMGVIPINVQGREFLTKSTGVMAALMASGDKLWSLADVFMKQFRYEHLLHPEDVKRRGVEDIPNYHYRDDGMMWWNNLKQYCEEFIALHYTSDELVKGDSELQNMVDEIKNQGYKRLPEQGGFPGSLDTIEQLIEYTTALIWNGSIWHTAVNFGQFNYLAFVPNAPCAMTMPPPPQDETITMERILLSLPVKEMARVQIDISYSLSLFSPVEKFYLGSVREEKEDLRTETMMVDEKEVQCIERLVNRLTDMQEHIDKRNDGLKMPYMIIRPDLTPLTVQT
ncbi:polyunsaturated fatty acid 5-lipoxygenase-like isoform X2 [Bolinopsis microptera]|uniref:polyunsaturated fatty acid 5-lipoxygenase-like isoform X2 n=1 Tax=Bolinopsis microptera TaxID=2820187 RepID=UPI003079C384